MGVLGLYTFIKCYRNQCVENVNLVDVAKEKGGIGILVDFYAFEHFVLNKFWESLCHATGNEYLLFMGGEYRALDQYVTKLVTDLRSVGINLVFFKDGTKGCSITDADRKLETWKTRHFSDIDKLKVLNKILEGQTDVGVLPDQKIRPVLLEVQLQKTLKTLQCEIVFTVGEADYVLAKQLHTRPSAFAVLSNDTDFCIFKDCRIIFLDFFDLDNSLHFGKNSGGNWLTCKPETLKCGLVYSETLANFLRLPTAEALTELSILLGNDCNEHLIRQLRHDIGFKNKQQCDNVYLAARIIREHHLVENVAVFAQEMHVNKELAIAVQQSRLFYSLTAMVDEVSLKGPMTQMLKDGVERGQFESSSLAMHNNFYWYRVLLENVSCRTPTSEEALSPLRSYIYRLVLNPSEDYVTEHGHTLDCDYSYAPVLASRDPQIPTLLNVDPLKIFHNLRLFNRILLHLDRDFQGRVNMFDRYGRCNGFLALTVRYMWVLNCDHNLCLSVEEWIPLVACIFCKVDEAWYCGLPILPSLRSITIGNWYQNIYRHAYCFLAQLLHINFEFPTPKETFSGAVFNAFYAFITNQVPDLPHKWLSQIKDDLNYIIGEKRHMIKFLLEPYVEFDTKFRNFFN